MAISNAFTVKPHTINASAIGESNYAVILPNGKAYHDGRSNEWPLFTAKIIARNISMKRKCTTSLRKVEHPVDDYSSYDRILAYVDTLKGKALTNELKDRGLSIGSDPVASKRERLIARLMKGTN